MRIFEIVKENVNLREAAEGAVKIYAQNCLQTPAE